MSADRHEARRIARLAHSVVRWRAKIMSGEPALTRFPSMTPCSPEPIDSCTSFGTFSAMPRSAAACTMAAASTWCEACSSEAPSISTSSAFSPGATSMERSRAPPTVSVPVLSNSTVWARASASSGPPPLTRMPRRADWATPAMKATGAARMSGHGVAATNTARLRMRSPEISQATKATASVNRQEHQRVAVGKPHEWRLGGLRRGHKAHDARIGAFAGRRRSGHFEGLAGVQRAAEGGGSSGLDHWDRFAGQRQFIDRRRVRCDDAVDRNDFAGPHQKPVANCDPPTGTSSMLSSTRRCATRGARSSSERRPCSARATAISSSTLPPEYISATTAPASGWPSTSAALIDTSAIGIDAEPSGQKSRSDRDRKARHHRNGRQRPATDRQGRSASKMRENSRG